MTPAKKTLLLLLFSLSAISCSDRSPTGPLMVAFTDHFGAMTICEHVQLSATVSGGSQGAVVPDSIHWSSSDASLASVSPTGLVTARHAAPSVTITAMAFADNRSGTGSMTFAVADNGATCPSLDSR